jgi:hypothetical protein
MNIMTSLLQSRTILPEKLPTLSIYHSISERIQTLTMCKEIYFYCSHPYCEAIVGRYRRHCKETIFAWMDGTGNGLFGSCKTGQSYAGTKEPDNYCEFHGVRRARLMQIVESHVQKIM